MPLVRLRREPQRLAPRRVHRPGHRRQDLQRTGHRWLVRFAPGASAQVLQAAGFTPVGDEGDGRWALGTPEASALNAALGQAIAGGALLVELHRPDHLAGALAVDRVEAGDVAFAPIEPDGILWSARERGTGQGEQDRDRALGHPTNNSKPRATGRRRGSVRAARPRSPWRSEWSGRRT